MGHMTKMNLPRAFRLISFWLLLGSAITGCANGNNLPYAPNSMLSSNQSASLVTTIYDGFNCPSYTNIIPDSEGDLDTFTACAKSTAPNEVLLEGHPTQTSTVCVFAANNVSGQIVPVMTSSNTPAVQCVNMSGAAAIINFQGLYYNALYVVSPNDEQTMYSCLVSGTPSNCPEYSYGQFR